MKFRTNSICCCCMNKSVCLSSNCLPRVLSTPFELFCTVLTLKICDVLYANVEQVRGRANESGDNNEAHFETRSLAWWETCKADRKVRRVNSKARCANILEYSVGFPPYSAGENFSIINASFNCRHVQFTIFG